MSQLVLGRFVALVKFKSPVGICYSCRTLSLSGLRERNCRETKTTKKKQRSKRTIPKWNMCRWKNEVGRDILVALTLKLQTKKKKKKKNCDIIFELWSTVHTTITTHLWRLKPSNCLLNSSLKNLFTHIVGPKYWYVLFLCFKAPFHRRFFLTLCFLFSFF